jgi:hypothetical protein
LCEKHHRQEAKSCRNEQASPHDALDTESWLEFQTG